GLEALFALVSGYGLRCEKALGAASPRALVDGKTLGEIYSRCHFGSSMPMLYAYPGDLAEERDPREWIESRYVGPLVHELSHFLTENPPAPANLHRDPALAADFHRRLVDPLLRGEKVSQRAWDGALDALPWRELPAWREQPSALDHNLAQRAERALRVRTKRRGLSFRAVRAEPP